MSNKLCEGDSKKSISLKSRFLSHSQNEVQKTKEIRNYFYNLCTTNFSYKITGANIIVPGVCNS